MMDTKKSKSPLRQRKAHSAYLATTFLTLLEACTNPSTQRPYAGPVATPQIAYRIDAHRYFEVVPQQHLACARARLYYTDTVRGIHSNVFSWDRVSNGTFIIDAANDQYLIAPIIHSSSDCQTGGGDFCSDQLLFSQDAGKTWKTTATYYSVITYLTGTTIYEHAPDHGGHRAELDVNIPDSQPSGEWLPGGSFKRYSRLTWTAYPEPDLPPPRIPPIDIKFQCKSPDQG